MHNENKMIVISILQWLLQQQLIKIYGYAPIAIRGAQLYSPDVGAIVHERKRVS